MKVSLILLGAAAVASAALSSDEPHSDDERFLCTRNLYQRCCGTPRPWKRNDETDEERNLCRWCQCRPTPPKTTTTKKEDPITTTKKPVEPTTTTKKPDEPITTTKKPEEPTTTSKRPDPTTPAPQPPQETGPGSCRALLNGSSGTYTDDSGVEYKVNCGKDIPGGDFAVFPVDTFEGCFDFCSERDECAGFSYLANNCYLKNVQNGPLVDSPADVAQKVGFTPPPQPPTTTTTTAAPTGPTPVPTGACKAIAGGRLGAYTVECETDYPGGDLSNSPSADFAGCAPQCDQLPGCLGFSYNGNVCFFKDNKTRAQPNPNVDSAFRPTPNIPGQPKPTTTTAPAQPTTTAKPTTTTTSKKPENTPAPQPKGLEYELRLYDDSHCKRPTQTLTVSRARQGECISLDALQKSDSFQYKTTGQDLNCRLVAYNLRNCSGRSLSLNPVNFFSQCIRNYDSVRYECK